MIDKTTGELVLVKKNDLVQEFRMKDMSLTDIRIINYLVANIHSPKYDREFREFTFTIAELSKEIGYSKGGNSEKLVEDSILNIAKKIIWKDLPDEECPGETKKVLIKWIDEAEIKKGIIKIKLGSKLAPYLLQVNGGYFQSKFHYSVMAKRRYTIPLYEVLKSWESLPNHTKTFEVLELREYMDVLQKSYEKFGIFKQRVLDPAIKEINEITDLNVSYELIKTGRFVTHVKFTILKKKEAVLTKENPVDPDNKPVDVEFQTQPCDPLSDFGNHLDEDVKAVYDYIFPDNLNDKEIISLIMLIRQHCPSYIGKRAEEEWDEMRIDDRYYAAMDYGEGLKDHRFTCEQNWVKDKVTLMLTQKKPVKEENYYIWLRRAIISDWK